MFSLYITLHIKQDIKHKQKTTRETRGNLEQSFARELLGNAQYSYLSPANLGLGLSLAKISSDKYKRFYHRLSTLRYDPIGNLSRCSLSLSVSSYKSKSLSRTVSVYHSQSISLSQSV